MRASRTFEPHADQVVEARRFVTSSLRRWGLGEDDVPLLVSELATNAVLHARSEFSVTVRSSGERVRVEVFDRNSRLPTFAAVKSDAYSGRGLMLVQSLSSAWGVDAHADDGKTIWFEVGVGVPGADAGA
jgi:anti-sigma regulatory factor (Ser/Thr protein kinase)